VAGVGREEVLRALCKCAPCTFEELVQALGYEGDLRDVRRLVADMVREGVVAKKPDYARGKVVLVSPEGCG